MKSSQECQNNLKSCQTAQKQVIPDVSSGRRESSSSGWGKARARSRSRSRAPLPISTAAPPAAMVNANPDHYMTRSQQDERIGLRDQGDRLLRRATFLEPADRAIIESLYGSGMTAVQVSNLTGITAGTIRRRARQLVQHLGSPLFTFVLLERGKWSPTRRRIAECHFLRRNSLRETVEKTQCTLHVVRRESDAVRAQFEIAMT